MAEQVHRVGRLARQRHRRGADAAVADHHRGHALRQLADHVRVADHFQIIMRMHINEARCQRQPTRVDDLRRVAIALADGDDAAVADGDVAVNAGLVAAVENQGVADQNVMH
ncbi:hypothetical protein D3C81_1854350 [compost metagenome]